MTTAASMNQRTGWASLRDLNRYQWTAFSVAAIAWLADCMDQQLFALARQTAITDLTGGDPTAPVVTQFSTWSTAIFLVGWSVGGLIFGIFGDRIGRVRTLTLTVLLYSIFTGLSAASVSVWDFCAYRFLTGLGVGGVFAAAVALIAETSPANARPFALGLMQSLSAVGNCIAAGLFIALGLLDLNGQLNSLKPLNAWRILFLIGLVPAVLVFFIQSRLEEPESWRKARDAAKTGAGKKLGAFADLFRERGIRRRAVFGLLLAFSGVVGLWGVGFFSLDLQQKIFRPTFDIEARELGLTGDEAKDFIKGRGIVWVGITSLMLNLGGFFGMNGFSWLTSRVGRRPSARWRQTRGRSTSTREALPALMCRMHALAFSGRFIPTSSLRSISTRVASSWRSTLLPSPRSAAPKPVPGSTWVTSSPSPSIIRLKNRRPWRKPYAALSSLAA
jgi:MFS family permease